MTQHVMTPTPVRTFDARTYGAAHTAADNLDAINAALADAGATVATDGGTARVVIGSGAKTYLVKPSRAKRQWLKLHSGVTLDLADITLKVADDSDAYNDLITGETLTTPLRHVRITGGLIDNNPRGHAKANLGIGSRNKAHSITSYAVQGLVIDGVTFNCSGVNTVVVNGPDCHDLSIEGNHFIFTQGATTTPDYDNSACYLVAEGIRVSNNRWEAAIAQAARGACEIHGHNAIMSGNTTRGYQTLANLVTPDHPYPGARNHIVVTANTAHDALFGVTLWPVTGEVLRDVTVSNNTIDLAQVAWNQPSAFGIARSRAKGITGDVEELTIANNLITFQPGDTRARDAAGRPLNYTSTAGIGLGGGGWTRRASVHGNTILHAPCYGARIGVVGSGALEDVEVVGNAIVDAGSNPHGVARMALALLGTASRSVLRDNRIRDTGRTALIGHYALVVRVTAGAHNVVAGNPVTTVSGLPLRTALAATADASVQYDI